MFAEGVLDNGCLTDGSMILPPNKTYSFASTTSTSIRLPERIECDAKDCLTDAKTSLDDGGGELV